MTKKWEAEKRDDGWLRLSMNGKTQAEIAAEYGHTQQYVGKRIGMARKRKEAHPSGASVAEQQAVKHRMLYLSMDVEREKVRVQRLKDAMVGASSLEDVLEAVGDLLPVVLKYIWCHEAARNVNIHEIYGDAIFTAAHRLMQIREQHEGLNPIRGHCVYKFPESE